MGTTLAVRPCLQYCDVDVAVDTTYYANYFGASDSLYITETEARCIMPKCRVKRLSILMLTNGFDSLTFTLLKNGSPTALAVSFSSGETGLKTATDDIAFEDGEEYSIQITYTRTGTVTYTSMGGVLFYGNY